MAIQYVSVRCPNCNTELEIDNTQETVLCTYCGTQFTVASSNQKPDASYYTFPWKPLGMPKKSNAGKICLFFFLALMLYTCVDLYGKANSDLNRQTNSDEYEDGQCDFFSTLTSKSKVSQESYEDIYNEYVRKLRNATPKLINEYYAESKENTNGIMGLATISNNKILKLAEISNEGVMKMANHMYATGGDYSEYDEWSTSLYSVYMEESGKISSAYMSSSMGAFGY